MRIAVLSMLEPLSADEWMPRAGLRVSGQSTIRHQLDLVVAAGAEKLLLLADPRTSGAETLLQAARDSGIAARTIADAPGLCGQVSAADELIILSDSLLPDPKLALPALQHGPTVATLPVEPALAAGFERLDAERAWAGLLVMPGSLCERLRQLPRDCDVASSLLRIALMAGVTTRPVDPDAIGSMRWTLISRQAAAQQVEAEHLARSLAETMGRTPGPRLAAIIVRRFGRRLFDADKSPTLVWWSALLPLLGGLVLAWFGIAGPAMLAMALCWLVARGAAVLDGAEKQGRLGGADEGRRTAVAAVVFDIGLLLVVGLSGLAHSTGASAAWFTALVLICALRLAERHFASDLAKAWLADRFSLCAAFALAAFLGVLQAAAMAGAAALLAVWAALDASGRKAVEG